MVNIIRFVLRLVKWNLIISLLKFSVIVFVNNMLEIILKVKRIIYKNIKEKLLFNKFMKNLKSKIMLISFLCKIEKCFKKSWIEIFICICVYL